MSSEKPANDYTKVPTKELLKDPDAEVPSTYGFGVRHTQLVIFFMCLTTSYVARAHLGVTIVAMTHDPHSKERIIIANLSEYHTADYFKEHNIKKEINEPDVDVAVNSTEVEMKVDDSYVYSNFGSIYRTYDWPKPIQEMILGSFFVGYFIMMFPAGMVCQRWGGKLPFQISLFINGIISFATPWMALWGGWKAMCFCRIVQALSQAGTYPSVQILLANWVSNTERGTMSSCMYTGTTLGTVIGFQISGLLAVSRWGWPSIFWTVGAICFISFILLTMFGAASPQQHNSISEEEKNFILGRVSDGIVQKPKVPWKAILTSGPVWASLATQACSSSLFMFFFTQVPSFIHYSLGIDVKNSGILSSLPYVASLFTSICFGIISDYCTNRNLISVKNARRINNSISQVGISVSLILASFATNTAIAVTCLVFGMGCHMGIHAGWVINHIDLAPNFTGTLMTIGNTLMNCLVLLNSVLVSYMVTDVKSSYQWRIMFGVVTALALISNAIFVIFLSTDRQPWDNNDYNVVKDDDVKDYVKEKDDEIKTDIL